MGTDILTLLRRDHDDLDKGLVTLLDRSQSLGQIRTALDGVRLGLTAHAEAIRNSPARPALEMVVEEAAHAHRLQEIALAAVVCTPLHTQDWYRRCAALHELVTDHSRYEETSVLSALRALAPDVYPSLAGKFATERLRQLSMLVPSAPVYIADLARAS